MMDIIEKGIIATVILATLFSIVMWSAGHDKEVMASAEKYEECVRTEMHTTVMAYYDQYGSYPECTK